MKYLSFILPLILCFSVSAAEKKSAPKKTAPKKQAASAPAKAPAKDWSLLTCGKDLKGLFENIEAYQKKLVSVADPLPLKTRQDLYAGESVFGESLTLLTPEVFWKDIIASRQSVGCHQHFKSLKKSLSTNDSKGTPAKLAVWNRCVTVLYGTLPAQTQRINSCVNQGIEHIKSRQQSAKKKKS